MTEEKIACPNCGGGEVTKKGPRSNILWRFGVIFVGIVFLGSLTGNHFVEPILALGTASVGILALVIILSATSSSWKDYSCQDCEDNFYKEKTKENESVKPLNVVLGMKEEKVRKTFKKDKNTKESEDEYLYTFEQKAGNFHYRISTKYFKNRLYEISLIAQNCFSNFSEVMYQVNLLHELIYKQYGLPSIGGNIKKTNFQKGQVPYVFKWKKNDTETGEIIKIHLHRRQNGYKPALSISAPIIAKEVENAEKEKDNFNMKNCSGF